MKRRDKKVTLEEEIAERALVRITQEILERNQGVKDLVSVGIRTGKVYLVARFLVRPWGINGRRIKSVGTNHELPFSKIRL